MTEQDLREKIGRNIAEVLFMYDKDYRVVTSRALGSANQILTIIKEALPELAKEAGYILPSKFDHIIPFPEAVTYPGQEFPPEAQQILEERAKANGYISLADVQAFLAKHSFPYKDVYDQDRVRYSFTDTQLEELLGKSTPVVQEREK